MKHIRDKFLSLTSSPTGRFLTIVAAAIAAIVMVRGCQTPKLTTDVSHLVEKDTIGERVRETDPRRFPTSPTRTNGTAPGLPPLRLVDSNAPASTGEIALPPRRLIPCKLVNTVDSSSLDTPVIGLVTQNVYWRGRLMIPKDTEVHGRAQAHHLRDRIGSQGAWILIWTNGAETSIAGVALDMDKQDGQWGPTDGSAGLRGSREQSGKAEEIKLFAATFLAGLTEPFQQRQNSLLGSQVLPTLKNAALSGGGEVIESYAERLLRTIERESTFVRVPGGKTFYLYTLDPLRPPIDPINNPSSPRP